MGFRFRKSKQLFSGIRVGIGASKNGISPSLSVGPRGSKIGIGKRGVNLGAGIPGSGLSYNKHFGWGKFKNMSNTDQDRRESAPKKFPIFKTVIGVVVVILAVRAYSPTNNAVSIDRSYEPSPVSGVDPVNQLSHLSDEELLALAERVEGTQRPAYELPVYKAQEDIERAVFEGLMDEQGNRLETALEHRQHTRSDLFVNFYHPLSNRTHEGWLVVEGALQDRADQQETERQQREAAYRQQEDDRLDAARAAQYEAQQIAQQQEQDRLFYVQQEQMRQGVVAAQKPRQITYYSASTNQPIAAPVANERAVGYATGYGEISEVNGRPRTNLVSGYTRANGTVVAPYYRSNSR